MDPSSILFPPRTIDSAATNTKQGCTRQRKTWVRSISPARRLFVLTRASMQSPPCCFFLLPGARSPRRKDNTVTRVSSTQSGPKPVLAGPDGPRPAPLGKPGSGQKRSVRFLRKFHTASGESLPGGQKGALAKLSFQGRRGGEPSRVSNLLSRLVV